MADEERGGAVAAAGTKVMAHSFQSRKRWLCLYEHLQYDRQGSHRPWRDEQNARANAIVSAIVLSNVKVEVKKSTKGTDSFSCNSGLSSKSLETKVKKRMSRRLSMREICLLLNTSSFEFGTF